MALTARTVGMLVWAALTVGEVGGVGGVGEIVSNTAVAQVPGTVPPAGIRESTPSVHFLTGGRVVIKPGQVIDNGAILIREGRIVAVGEVGKLATPPDAQVWDCQGKTIYPGFIDAYSEVTELLVPATGAAGGSPSGTSGGGKYWNSRVSPETLVAESYRVDAAANRAYRSQGVVARLLTPTSGKIIKGISAIVDTGQEPVAQAIIRERAAQHVTLQPTFRPRSQSSGDEDRYPTSPMGAMTLVRQALYDAKWYESAWIAVREDGKLPRPERNESLEALQEVVKNNLPLMVDAQDELYALRADEVGKEFQLKSVSVRGSGQEYRLATEIAQRGRPVVVPLAFARPPSVATPEQAISVSLMDLMSWDLSPENPARLEKAGVKIALTAQGLSAQRGETFLGQVRKAVARGLTEEGALAAMTTHPAEILNVSNELGTLEVGKAASFVIADGPLFAERTRVMETWVDGIRYEVTATPTVKAAGRWTVTIGSWGGTIDVIEENGRLRGELRPSGAASQPTTEPTTQEAEPSRGPGRRGPASRQSTPDISRVSLSDSKLSFTVRGPAISTPAGYAGVSGTIVGDKLVGSALLADGTRVDVTGTRSELPTTQPASRRSDTTTAPTSRPTTKPASYEPNWPLGEYGRQGLPEQKRILFRNATVWTGEADGILKNASVYVENGKIATIFGDGATPKLPDGTVVIDCTGKHLTAGVIDAHSHMATDGGVNESGQTISAEVRIGDFIDPTDIAIYRQLAGGVTAANILHGSANTIGGQNQVVKLRWGATPEQLKFEGAPPGIKFALGENPKQSNWGDNYTSRYPQTRMGVEQLVRDEFAAAKAYREAWTKYKSNPAGMLPPRVDLELEAVAEIIEKKRWIHCHSYRQDEILSLVRTTAEWGITIGSFQHILEGYKVADELAKAGITASGFTDWWGYKVEVQDAIPYSPAIMWKQGVVCSLNSDDAELATRLYLEAGKAVKYGGVPELEAWKMVTLNAAKTLRIDDRVGSIKPGKDADVVVWSTSPLSTATRAEQTWIDGRCYFSVEQDAQSRKENLTRHAALVQKVLASGEEAAGPNDPRPTPAKIWANYDEFCGLRHDNGENQNGR